MRALRIPCFVLLILLALSLANSAAMQRRCAQWRALVDDARRFAREEQWAEADAKLKELENGLSSCALWLHITTSHDAVDEADRLLARARLMCALRDGVHTEESLAELRVLLHHAAENEQLLMGNIM